MAKMYRTEAKTGPLMRVSYAQQLQKGREQKKDDGSTRVEYGATFIIPKADTVGVRMLQSMIAEAVEGQWGAKGVERFKNGLIRNPLLPGDGKEARNKESGEINPGLGPDMLFIRAKSNDAVPIFTQRRLPAGPEELKSGYWVYPVLNVFTWHNAQNGDGVSFGVDMVQIVKEDEVLGGDGPSRDPTKYFETLDGPDANDAPSLKGGAADMFG